jgi:hypothetical protein
MAHPFQKHGTGIAALTFAAMVMPLPSGLYPSSTDGRAECRNITNEERHFAGSRSIINCADDKEALSAAKQWVDFFDVELWEGSRFVARLHPV